MKKKYVVILIVVIIAILILVSAIVMMERRKNDESEAVQIFEKRAAVEVTVEASYENIDEIQKNIEDMQYVKNVTLVSSEDRAEDFKDYYDNEELFDGMEMDNMFPDSFIIRFDIDSVDDFENLKTIEADLMEIDGIDEVEAEGCTEMIDAYEQKGIEGLREIDNKYTQLDE